MNIEMHPYMLSAIFVMIAALVAIVIACRRKSAIVTAMVIMLAFALMIPLGCFFAVFHPEFIDGRYRTYKRFYRDIHVGMTREQVLAAMEKRYSTNEKRKSPTILSDTPKDLSFFMNPESSREPNCEGIFLTLQAGRVTRISYSAD